MGAHTILQVKYTRPRALPIIIALRSRLLLTFFERTRIDTAHQQQNLKCNLAVRYINYYNLKN